ncbi:MAG: DinB family protein [Rhodothermales bacterium]
MNVPADRRTALLDQLGYLVAEVEVLAPLLARLPADYLAASLPGERSVLATLAHLAALDREVYTDRLRRIVSEDEPAFDAADPDGVVRGDLAAALADVRIAREALLDAFERVPAAEWSRAATFPDGERRDVAGFALAIAHHDAAELRRLAYRMHESHITERAVDLPK